MPQQTVLVVGGGAREHVLATFIQEQEPNCMVVIACRGERKGVVTFDVDPMNVQAIVQAAKRYPNCFVIIGPEAPLQAGLADKLRDAGIGVFGPSAAAARLETSKIYGLNVLQTAHVPHPRSWVCYTPAAVKEIVRQLGGRGVVKQDGLAAGKGVEMCFSPEQAENVAFRFLSETNGAPLLVQKFLEGEEVSLFGFTDGWNISPLAAVCDHKLLDGKMTGGVGSYMWPKGWGQGYLQEQYLLETIVKPIVRGMFRRGTPLKGMVYVALMMTKEGPMVLEVNVRPGDPETQAFLPAFKGSLLGVCKATQNNTLDQVEMTWEQRTFTVAVVLVAKGYPGCVEKPAVIKEPRRGLFSRTRVFYGNPRGRAATVVVSDPGLMTARDAVYWAISQLSLEHVDFPKDIAQKF
jgi:phosphoribosylamine---glycine ligase